MSDRLLVSTRKGLFTLDRGASGWKVSNTSFLAENVTLSHVDPRDGGWYAALNLGHFGVKLKYSPDAGKTWEDRAVPAYPEGETFVPGDGKPPVPATLKMIWALETGDASQPGRVWAGTLPGGLFRSADGGRTWDQIKTAKPTGFGFGVAVHPNDPQTAWFVPATKDERRIPVGGRVVVSRTRDGGETFDVLRDGLPQEHAYDIVYRHALAIDQTGDRLAFGSTTGGLWVSENQGERWTSISHTLPPIHAVRFV